MSTANVTPDPAGGIRLWGIGTGRTLRPMWTLLELGLAFEVEPILTRSPAMETPTFRAVSPRGKIPMLDDGALRIGESAAISIFEKSTTQRPCVRLAQVVACSMAAA